MQGQGRGTSPAGRMKLLVYQCTCRSRQKGWVAHQVFLRGFVRNRRRAVNVVGERSISILRGRALACPSFDRIDNSKGYVAGNVGVICYECNMIKNSGTLRQHEAIVAYMGRTPPAPRWPPQIPSGWGRIGPPFAVKRPEVSRPTLSPREREPVVKFHGICFPRTYLPS